MKSFLLDPGHDFDMTLNPAPWSMDVKQDLELDVVFEVMAKENKMLHEVVEAVILRSLYEPTEIIYRQSILQDCLANRDLIRMIFQLVGDTIEQEKKNRWSLFHDYPSYVLNSSIQSVQLFVDSLGKLRDKFWSARAAFHSEGFGNLIAMLKRELQEDYFSEIKGHLASLKFNTGFQMSAKLGQDLKSTDFTLRKPIQAEGNIFKRALAPRIKGFSFMISDQDESSRKALSGLVDRGLGLAANALGQSSDHMLSFFKMLQAELAFYIGCLNLAEKLEATGQPYCFPEALQLKSREMRFRELKDLVLVLQSDSAVVGNDLTQDHLELALITGANQGGKTIYLRSIGLAQVLMQSGLFVTAAAYSTNVSRSILTHFKREEDKTMRSGKLDEEMSRMRQVVNALHPDSLVLMNESFASTNEKEGSEIARQIVRALIEKGIKIVYVTHLNDFAWTTYANRKAGMVFLVAERTEDGTRTFRILEGEPAQTSFGEDLYGEVFSSQ